MTAKITLGGIEHELAPVTIGRLEQIQAALLKPDYPSSIAHSVALLNVCLVKPIGDDTPATLSELQDEMRRALANAGFKLKEPMPGEAPAT